MQAWAYHVFLDYSLRDDTPSSFRRGWKTEQRYKLDTVVVSAKDSLDGSGRRRVRKYTLSYVTGSHALLLDSVQVEGRCSEAEAGERCTLPPMNFGYTHVETNSSGRGVFVDGFEVIDSTVRSIAGSPKHSVNEDYTDLYDVNSDGLPDTIGRPAGEYVTEYTYRDPHFDGVQREFRGFAETTVRTVGDSNSPTSESRTEFLLGRRPDGIEVYEDNPREALKGLPTRLDSPRTGC